MGQKREPAEEPGTASDRFAALTSGQFAQILDGNQPALYAFVRPMVGNREDARDVVQDVFVAAWQASQRQEAPFTAHHDAAERRRWLFRVAYRRAASSWHRQTWAAAESLDVLGEPPAIVDDAWTFERRVAEDDALRTALGCLAAQDAACILLNVVHGFTCAEMARILDITPDAARQRFSRAMRRLRSVYFTRQGRERDREKDGGPKHAPEVGRREP